MGYMLETRGLTKRFGRGDQAQDAVADVSLHIREGEVYGLLGPNGAGKSTTLKMICGMLRPTAGEILFAGHAWRREDLYAIGSLIEEAPLYPNLTARENLRVRTTLLGLPESRIDEVLAAVDLADTGKKRAGRLANLTAVPSRGRAVAAKLLALAALGAAALAVALGVFGAVLAVAGRLPIGPAPLAAAWAGIVLGSLPLYALGLGVALRLGRNAAIGAGAAGMLLAFFSLGGLAHGLMTGELTGALATPLSWVPLAWPARLGSLGVEAFIDAARAAGPLLTTALAGLVLALAAAAVLLAWFCRFEDGRADE